MWYHVLAVFCLALTLQAQYYDDGWENLGEEIRASVEDGLKPLKGLGSRINAQVQRNLRPMQIQLNSRLSELEGLGDRINQQVQHDLEPVRAIELNFKMRDGVGGTTIVKHRPSGQQFIVKNYRTFICSSPVNEQTGECSGTLSPFEITSSSPRSDWCYYRSYSIINNMVCMGVGSMSVSAFNNQVFCKSNDNKPTILISLDDYKKMCSSVSETVEYRYIPDQSNPAHVAIPNANKYVKCENQQKNYCVFTERNGLLDSYASGNGGGTFIVQNYGGSGNNFRSY